MHDRPNRYLKRLAILFLIVAIPILINGRAESMIHIYPVEAEHSADAPYEVTANGVSVPLEHVDEEGAAYYARIACDESVHFEVRAGTGIQARVQPERLAGDPVVKDGVLRFAATEPGPRVVRLTGPQGELPLLYIFTEPPESGAPSERGAGIFNVSDFGVVDSATPQTEGLQRALDACADSQGGGIVYIPNGRYLTGSLTVHGNTQVYLAEGAILQSVRDPEAFTASARRTEVGRNASTAQLLFFDGAVNSGLMGRGTIDGNGPDHPVNLHAIDAFDCRNLVFRDVVLRNSRSWTLHLVHCDNVYVNNLKIVSAWKDGIDPDACRNVLVENTFCDTRDDSMVVKVTGRSDLRRESFNITCRDSVVLCRKTALKVGTETRAPIRNVTFENIDVIRSSRGIAIWVRDGFPVEDIIFRNIRMDLVEVPGESRSGQPFYLTLKERGGVGSLRNVRIEDITCDAPWFSLCESLPQAPFENVVFNNILLKVMPRTLKTDPVHLFGCIDSGTVTVRNLKVDWTEAKPEQWKGLFYHPEFIDAEDVVEVR